MDYGDSNVVRGEGVAGALKEALKKVKTRYVFVVQDDTWFTGRVDLEELMNAFQKREVKCVAFTSEVRMGDGLSPWTSPAWPGFPLLARTSYLAKNVVPIVELTTAPSKDTDAFVSRITKYYGVYVHHEVVVMKH